ncbi:MAG: hypothetical protein P8Z73_14105, partial [Desulfobacteraceae bacterium]
MKAISRVFIIFLAMGLVAACSTPEQKAYKAQAKSHDAQAKTHNAQEKIIQERLKLVDEYKKCLEKAGDDKTKADA